MNIGIALSGGGIKGATHIGVLKALEENNIEIYALAGTSMGSVIATLYAMGYNTDEIFKLLKYFAKSILKADPKYLLTNFRYTKSFFGTGIISGEAIEDAIDECARLKGMKYIKDIPMPIAIPTVDIKEGKEYVFTNKNDKETTRVEQVKGKNGESLLHRLDLRGICVSTGSACNGSTTHISHVLKAIGLNKDYAIGTIRVSIGKENTIDEIHFIANELIRIISE